ncbi:MAG: DHH family phosphoesterase [Planctomycetota bacterium]|jgi:nanoRNase/pAp phosphatase (c-di-AMP/oligoRNAs hydrolase)
MDAKTPTKGGAPEAGTAERSDLPPHDAGALLRRFIDVARGKRRPLIHLQHNPDPDALASGVALQYLLKRLLGLDTILTHTGQVGRSENRAMLRWLGIQIIPSYKIDYAEYDLVMVVDTHPGSGTCRLPEGVVPDVVVDHHPVVEEVEGVALPFLAIEFGSTSTMVGWLLVENDIPVDARVATALTYGIRTDTQDLSRSAGPVDDEVFRVMYAAADKRVLGRIERARLPQEYFEVLERGLRHGQVTDFAVTTYLGSVRHSDAVAEIADILFRLEGMRWAMVAGRIGQLMSLSIRAVQADKVDAGKVAHKISNGFGGGHDTYAGAQVPLPADGSSPEAFYDTLRLRFIKAIRAKKSLTRPLTLPPGATG